MNVFFCSVDAEKEYCQLAENDNSDGKQLHTDYYYFYRFKMSLYKQKVGCSHFHWNVFWIFYKYVINSFASVC